MVLPLMTPDIRPSNTKPICEMVENASMRLRLVCAMAAKLPTTNDPIASSISICCQSSANGNMPSTSKRMKMPNAASLGAPPINSVTAVGAPWYTSGIHMWNGTTPSLKASPATMNTRPNTSTWCLIWPLAMACATSFTSSEPVAPYNIDMPYNRKPEAMAPSTKYFIAASVATSLSRRKATSA